MPVKGGHLRMAVACWWLWLLFAQFVAATNRTFYIQDNRFYLDRNQSLQIISGSVHYFRIHPAYWRDRLTKLRALGLNTITTYVPWNWHEPMPGVYDFTSPSRDVVNFVRIAADLGLYVIIRPGPYICSEWDMGGMPWWLAATWVDGGREMEIRSADPRYMQHVERFWGKLLPLLQPYFYSQGGPILMLQMENELGFFGKEKGLTKVHDYLHALINLTTHLVGNDILLFTVDPPYVIEYGTLSGGAIYSTVDFYPGTDIREAFAVKQAGANKPGMSPPFVTEFYPGFHPWWGFRMHQTNASLLVESFSDILRFHNNTGNVNFYCVSGGTNGFGLWSGANIPNGVYQPMATTYDSGYPLGESGDYGQRGLGGPNKYMMIRDVILNHTGMQLPAIPPPPLYHVYNPVYLHAQLPLMPMVEQLLPEGGVVTQYAEPAEEYRLRCGLILYRAHIPQSWLTTTVTVHWASAIHDYSTVMLNGQVVGYTNRSEGGAGLQLGPVAQGNGAIQLDILVEAMGRGNFFSTGWDLKGVVNSSSMTINGKLVTNWTVYPLGFDGDLPSTILFNTAIDNNNNNNNNNNNTTTINGVTNTTTNNTNTTDAAVTAASYTTRAIRVLTTMTNNNTPADDWTAAALGGGNGSSGSGTGGNSAGAGGVRGGGGVYTNMPPLVGSSTQERGAHLKQGPVLYRGTFIIEDSVPVGANGFLPDTYLDTRGWGKGIAWVNDNNLGWYWPLAGPQLTLYVPGPMLRVGVNTVTLLELHQQPQGDSLSLTWADRMNWGPIDPPPPSKG